MCSESFERNCIFNIHLLRIYLYNIKMHSRIISNLLKEIFFIKIIKKIKFNKEQGFIKKEIVIAFIFFVKTKKKN